MGPGPRGEGRGRGDAGGGTNGEEYLPTIRFSGVGDGDGTGGGGGGEDVFMAYDVGPSDTELTWRGVGLISLCFL